MLLLFLWHPICNLESIVCLLIVTTTSYMWIYFVCPSTFLQHTEKQIGTTVVDCNFTPSAFLWHVVHLGRHGKLLDWTDNTTCADSISHILRWWCRVEKKMTIYLYIYICFALVFIYTSPEFIYEIMSHSHQGCFCGNSIFGVKNGLGETVIYHNIKIINSYGSLTVSIIRGINMKRS